MRDLYQPCTLLVRDPLDVRYPAWVPMFAGRPLTLDRAHAHARALRKFWPHCAIWIRYAE